MNDIANTKPTITGPLKKAGMQNIELLFLPSPDLGGQGTPLAAKANAFVSLSNPDSRGIHMSRLYLLLETFSSTAHAGLSAIKNLLEDFLESHAGISDEAFLDLSFEIPIKRKALLSQFMGTRFYPVRINASLDTEQRLSFRLSLEILYSSTCPCSAALSRELNGRAFKRHFADQPTVDAADVLEWLGTDQSQAGTPHGQRSKATITLDLKTTEDFDLIFWIDQIEGGLKTPVQGPVKRIDEQEFARLNAENLMFAEDAARRIQNVLLDHPKNLKSFEVKVEHFESLHPHDAVACAKHTF